MISSKYLVLATVALCIAQSNSEAAIDRYYFSGTVSSVIVNAVSTPAGINTGTPVSGWLDYNTNAPYRFTSSDGYSAFYDSLFVNGSITVASYQWSFDSAAPNAIGMLSSFTNDQPMSGVPWDFVYLWTSLSKQMPFTFAPGAEYGSISISGGTTDTSALPSSQVPATLDLLRFNPSIQLMQLNTGTNEQLSVFVSLQTFPPVPEPAAALLFAAGFAAIMGGVCIRRRSGA